MKALLITFAVLLLLLTLLSTFGGSIRSEPFYQPALQQTVDPREYYYNTTATHTQQEQHQPQLHISEQYEAAEYPFDTISEQYADVPPVMPQAPQMPSVSMPQMPADLIKKVENVGSQMAQAGLTAGSQMAQVAQSVMPTLPQAVPVQQNPIQEGFNIEPFEEEEKLNFAAF